MILKGKYRKTIILGIVLLVSVIAFWVGLKAILRTEFPLLPMNSTGMYPALNYGDLIVVQGVANVIEINVASSPFGDIIVFRRPSNPEVLIVSRVMDKTFQNGVWYLRTQLDTRNSPDWWISGLNSEDTWNGFFHEKFLVGKVVGKIHYLGYIPLYVSAFLQTSGVILLFIVLMFLFILLKYRSLQKKKVETPS